MSGAIGKSKNKSKNNQSFNQEVWQPGGDALQNLYGQLGGMFEGQQNELMGQGSQGIQNQQQVFDKQLQPWEQQMRGGAYADMGVQDKLMSSLDRSSNQPSNMQDINSMIMGGSGNGYADAMKDQYVSDANRAQENMLGNLDARAAASGMSGGARHGVATGRGMEDINSNLQRNMAQTGFNTFDKDLDRKLNIAQQADQNDFGRQQLMSDLLGQQQGAMNQGMNQGNQMFNQGSMQQQAPWQVAGQYSNSIGSPTVLGYGTSGGSGSGKGFSTSGGVG